MNHDPRPHIHRRGRAIERLRALTTGAAVASLAGTAGFGLLAAVTWSGNATSGTSATAPSTSTVGSATSGSTRLAPNSVAVNPVDLNAGGTVQQPPVAAPRVQRVSGGGHATTGGSH